MVEMFAPASWHTDDGTFGDKAVEHALSLPLRHAYSLGKVFRPWPTETFLGCDIGHCQEQQQLAALLFCFVPDASHYCDSHKQPRIVVIPCTTPAPMASWRGRRYTSVLNE